MAVEGDKIRIRPGFGGNYFKEGATAVLAWKQDDGLWWADFNQPENEATQYDGRLDGVWCVGSGERFTVVSHEVAQLQARVAELEGALRPALEFVETFSNRWDGQQGRHPWGIVQSARKALGVE